MYIFTVFLRLFSKVKKKIDIPFCVNIIVFQEPDIRRIKWTQQWVPRYLYQHVYVPLVYCLVSYWSQFIPHALSTKCLSHRVLRLHLQQVVT